LLQWRTEAAQSRRVSTRSSRWAAHYTVVLLVCAAAFISYIDRTNISVGVIAMQAQLGWNETQKGLVLSAFFGGYLLMMVASGALANRYGGKMVLGIAVIWWSLFTALTPPAALLSLSALILARTALGLGEAAVFPASINMIGRWVPAGARSRAVTLLVSSIHLGTVFALPITGWLIQRYNWPLPFYLFGALGLVWAAAWFTKVSSGWAIEPPAEHGSRAIPWKRLLSLPCVWAIAVGHFSANWSLYMLLAWLPSYFKSTFGVNIVNAGALSMVPWLVAFFTANLAAVLADRLLHSGWSATRVRKLMQCGGLIGTALFLMLLPAVTSVNAGLVLMCCATGSLACCLPGFGPNGLDIAPRYADVIFGISNTFATLPGIFGVLITGWLIERTGSYAAPFLLSAGVAVFGALIFGLFASGDRKIT
jgi:MFS transporter, ACS family, solute carrier family 17 (sodium-dependent inorganic phosphate cotransporter), other